MNDYTLVLKLPSDEGKAIVESFAKKTGWIEKTSSGKEKKTKSSLSAKEYAAKILQDRLISYYK